MWMALCLSPLTAVHALGVGDYIKFDKFVTVEGRQFTSSDLKGKYLVVQVWATWCPYCHRQNANLKELVRRTQGGQFTSDDAVGRQKAKDCSKLH